MNACSEGKTMRERRTDVTPGESSDIPATRDFMRVLVDRRRSFLSFLETTET